MAVILGLDLMLITMLYGYCLAAQPRYATPGARRVAAWTHRQPLPLRVAIAFTVWVMFMTGLQMFALATG